MHTPHRRRPTLYLSLSLLSLLFALILWRVACRGKRLDDHPICRKCSYDLFGLPPDSARCSECGSDLKAKHALRIGNRRPYAALAWTGILLTILSLPAIALAGHNWWQHFSKWPWVPFALLEREYKAGNRDAMDELDSRIARGKLSKAQASKFVSDATAWQDDPTVNPFAPFVTVSRYRGDLLSAGVDPALIEAYDDHPYRVDMKSHAQVPRGTFFPFRLTFAVRPKAGLIWLWEFEVKNPKARVQIGNSLIELKSPPERPLSETDYDRDSMVVGTDAPEFWQHEHGGRIEGTLIVDMDVDTGTTKHIRRAIPFSAKIVASAVPAITYVANPKLDAQMASSFHADSVVMSDGRIVLQRILPGFGFKIDTLPENVALEVYFEQADHKWPQGVLVRAAGRDPIGMYFTPRLARNLPPDDPPRYFIGEPWRRGLSYYEKVPTDLNPKLPLNLVLKSNPDLAATHSGFDRVWQGEIRIPVSITPFRSLREMLTAPSAKPPPTPPAATAPD